MIFPEDAMKQVHVEMYSLDGKWGQMDRASNSPSILQSFLM